MNILSPSSLLLPKSTDQQTVERISYCAKALERLFNIGTRILEWELTSTQVDQLEKAVVVTMFRRYLELLDSARILVENRSVVPCYGTLRMLLELFFEFDYLLKDKAKLGEYILAYLIMELDGQLANAEFTLSDPEMINLRNALPTYIKNQEVKLCEAKIKECNTKIAMTTFDAIRPVYEQKVFPKKGVRNENVTKWYTLTGKISGTRWLTENLDQKRLHYYVYGESSNVIHSSNLFEDTIIPIGTEISVRMIRDVSRMDIVVPALIKVTVDMYATISPRATPRQREELRLAILEFRSTYKDIQPSRLVSPLI